MERNETLQTETGIKGIGIDLVDIGKIGKMLSLRGEKFHSRIFSENELAAINSIKSRNKARAFQKAAGFFAAKEAFLKALGAGLFSIPLNRITVSNEKTGEPCISIDVPTADLISRKCKKTISSVKLSITHDGGFACAVAVVQ